MVSSFRGVALATWYNGAERAELFQVRNYASGDEVIEYKWRETGDGVYLECLGDKADLKFTDDGPDKLKTTIMFFVTLSFKRIK